MWAHDTYAETNPAFCAIAIHKFCSAFLLSKDEAPNLPLIYIVLPIVLSDDLSESFKNTTANTLLADWIQRNAWIKFGFDERVNGTLQITTDAIRFGCQAGILAIDNDLHVLPGLIELEKKIPASNYKLDSLTYAERLGRWFANAGTVRTIINSFDLTL